MDENADADNADRGEAEFVKLMLRALRHERGCAGSGRADERPSARLRSRSRWYTWRRTHAVCAYSDVKREPPDTAIDVQRDAEEQRVWKEFTKELA